MIQYRYILEEKDIIKWVNGTCETSTLNTPINKDVYYRFKNKVKADGYYIKHVISAFIEDYTNHDMNMEFVKD